MGPSGSGKSTLLYLLGGLDRPTAAASSSTRRAQTWTKTPAAYRREIVGFVFQSFNLIPA
jgi:putative ABC transport system ATP-binding protein